MLNKSLIKLIYFHNLRLFLSTQVLFSLFRQILKVRSHKCCSDQKYQYCIFQTKTKIILVSISIPSLESLCSDLLSIPRLCLRIEFSKFQFQLQIGDHGIDRNQLQPTSRPSRRRIGRNGVRDQKSRYTLDLEGGLIFLLMHNA